MNNKIFVCLGIVLCFIFLIFSCTSIIKGSTYGNTADSFKRSSPGNTPTPQPGIYFPESTETAEEEEEGRLFIESTPSGATVYINNSFKGITPVTLTDFEPGTYRITIIKEGYYDETFWIEYNGSNKDYHIVLKAITGYLVVYSNVKNAEISAGGFYYSEAPLELPIGSYTLRVRAFSYEEYTKNITIYEKRTTEVEVFLQEAAFILSDPGLSRSVFSPDNPGLLGISVFSFRVTSYGIGTFSVKNEAGEEVFSETLPRFTSWSQSYTWNGRGIGGKELEDGIYTIVVTATGERDGVQVLLESEIRIDRSYVITYRIPWTGVSGLIYTATPDVLPPFSFQLSGHVFLTPDFFTSDNGASFTPVNTGIRFGLPGKSELDLVFSPVFVRDSEILPFIVTGAWKQRLFSVGSSRGLRGAFTARGTYLYATNADIYTNYTGLTLGLPLALDSGVVSLILNPELTFSPYRVIYGTAEDQTPALHMWLYGKAGIVVDTGTVMAALSGSMRSLSFTDGFDLNYPVNAALELNLLIPGTLLFFSADATLEFISTADYYISLGMGLSLLY